MKFYRFPLIGFLIVLIGMSCALEKRDQIFHLRGDYNYKFYKNHPQDYALTTVAHWAHGRISDILLEAPQDTRQADEAFFAQGKWFLEHPSRVEPHQDYVAPEFARLAWWAIRVVDWTHQLHEQLYDIMTDPGIPLDQKKKWIDRSVDYYLSEPEMAFSPAPFEEVVMSRVQLTHQPWFKAFRTNWPKSNGLFWAFHWWHPVIYEVQLLNPNLEDQKRAIREIDDIFMKDVVLNPPQRMHLSREVMPRFSQLSPEAANIFDNLHMFHGIVYDILASPKVQDKKKEIYRMIDLMTAQPGDREMAKQFPITHLDSDPMVYSKGLQGMGGEMGRIMGHGKETHHHHKGGS
jgi:hypothetical protein